MDIKRMVGPQEWLELCKPKVWWQLIKLDYIGNTVVNTTYASEESAISAAKKTNSSKCIRVSSCQSYS